MPGLLKRKLFIQARRTSYGESPTIQVTEHEFKTDAFTTYVTLGTTVVEFADPCLTNEQFEELRSDELSKLKAKIMADAKKQCEALT